MNIAYRQQRWGMYDDIAEETGIEKQTLKDFKWVSENIETSLRKDNLSFNHHKEVASLPPDKQEMFLNKAIFWIKENAISQRNLNDYQRSKLVLELEGYYKAQAKERLKTSTGGKNPRPVQNSAQPVTDTGKVRDKLAEKAGVSHDTISKVKFIDNNAVQEIKEQLERGDISINKQKTPVPVKIQGQG